jgi:hypothetical protein
VLRYTVRFAASYLRTAQGVWCCMADEEHGSELPQRVKGAIRAAPPAPAPSFPPPLPEELRQRIQAAIEAERAEATTQEREQTTVPPGGPTAPGGADSEVIAPGAKGINGKRKRAAAPVSDDKAKPVARSKPVAGATPDVIGEGEELTDWLGVQPAAATRAAGARPANSKQDATLAQAGRQASPSPAVAKKPTRRRRRGRLAAPAVIVVLAALLSVVAVQYFTRPSVRPPTAAQLHQAEAARSEAVAWVVRHVSRNAPVACDPVVRAALAAHGFPSRELLQLTPTIPDTFAAAAAVVVETPAVQSMFGSSLDGAWAPDVLASFGSGAAKITVRVIARHGAVAYRTALNGDLAARKTAGAALLDDSQLSIPVLAEKQLAAGRVDSRLLLALADLAGHRPVVIVRFGSDGPGASADVPLRFVDLAENVQAAHLGRAAYVNAVRAFLGQVSLQYRPASIRTVPADGQAVLRVTVTAPSPFGVFPAPGSL